MIATPEIRPFICYYGAKWLAAKRYPEPQHPIIIEPFAGAAGYSTRYHNRRVELYDVDPIIYGLWDYLIHAKESDIRRLPVRVNHIDDVPASVCQEAKWLIGFWLNPGSSRPKRTRGTWKSDKVDSDIKYWSPRIVDRIASQQQYIRHWKIHNKSYIECDDITATWFIDPPYQTAGRHYTHRLTEYDYSQLAAFCHVVSGQVIVCEATGADWLPFTHFRVAKSAHYRLSAEAIWLKNS